MKAIVRLPFGSSSFLMTLPTDTPAMRTSACSASCVASGKAARSREPFGESGIEPPNESHRNRSSAKQDSVKPTMTATRPGLGVALFMVGSARGVPAERLARQDRGQVQGELGADLLRDELVDRRAAQREEQRAVAAVGVLRGEQRDGLVVEPCQPEEVTLLAALGLRPLG